MEKMIRELKRLLQRFEENMEHERQCQAHWDLVDRDR